jgi:Bromodomain extra-terminal - transcription regulation/Bromodomain
MTKALSWRPALSDRTTVAPPFTSAPRVAALCSRVMDGPDSAPRRSARGAPRVSAAPAPLSPPSDARRTELLRRLNQIERQRTQLQRVRGGASFGTMTIPAHALAASAATVSDVPAKRGRAQAVQTADTKRHRSAGLNDTVVDSSTGNIFMPPPAPPRSFPTSSVRARHQPQHSPAVSARAQTSSKPPPTPILHLDALPGQAFGSASPLSAHPSPERPPVPGKPDDIRLFAAGAAVGAGGAQALPSPPASPSSRATGRVRTPSVLLAQQPGEAQAMHATGRNNQVSYCLRIVKDLLRLKDSFAFSKPIDKLWPIDQLPGYFEMIAHPIDLATIRDKLENGGYVSSANKVSVPGDDPPITATSSPNVAHDNSHGFLDGPQLFESDRFATDVRLVFRNARTYNRPGDIFYEAAGRLLEKFDGKFAKLPDLKHDTGGGNGFGSSKKSKKKKKGSGGGGGGSGSGAGGCAVGGVTSGYGGGAMSKNGDNKRRKSASGAGGASAGATGSGGKSKSKRQPRGEGGGGGSGGVGNLRNTESEISASPKDASKMSRGEMEQRLDALKRHLALTEAGPASPSASPPGVPSYIAQAQAMYHVPMTFEDKVRLSQNVEKLPGDKLQKLVTLISKASKSTMEVNNNEEIELDIDHMDNKTLRDMEAFVNQTLYRRKGGRASSPAMSTVENDIAQLSRSQLNEQIGQLGSLLRRSSGEKGGKSGETKQKSFYDADSDSSSDSEGSSGSSSSGSDSSGSDSDSDSSDDSDSESEGEKKRKRRELNLEHQRQMSRAHAGSVNTPLPSPSYSAVQSNVLTSTPPTAPVQEKPVDSYSPRND